MRTNRNLPAATIWWLVRNLTAAATICLFLVSHALAQSCTGTGPWANCTTWPGPQRSTFLTGIPNEYAWSDIDNIDLNGDGLTDFGQLYGMEPGITLSTGTGFAPLIAFTSNTNCYTGNFDDSGRTSVLCPTAGTLTYASSNGTGLNSFTNIPGIPSTNIWSPRYIYNGDGESPYPVNACMVMDVNGDGADDLVCGGAGGPVAQGLKPYGPHTPNSTTWGVYLSGSTLSGPTPVPNFTYQTWSAPAGAYSYGFACVPGNFDGDGMQDLACNYGGSGGAKSTNWVILHSKGTGGWFPETWTNGPTGPAEAAQYSDGCTFVTATTGLCPVSCVPGDFNGDGLGDVGCDNGNNTWTIGFSGTSGQFMSTPLPWNGKSVVNQLLPVASLFCDVSDIYGIGRSGIVCNFVAGSTSWDYLESTGTSFNEIDFTTPFPVGATTGPYDQMTLSTGCVIADLNGDGIMDAACVQSTNSGTSGSGTWNMALSTRPN
jgi:hypothetical protein